MSGNHPPGYPPDDNNSSHPYQHPPGSHPPPYLYAPPHVEQPPPPPVDYYPPPTPQAQYGGPYPPPAAPGGFTQRGGFDQSPPATFPFHPPAHPPNLDPLASSTSFYSQQPYPPHLAQAAQNTHPYAAAYPPAAEPAPPSLSPQQYPPHLAPPPPQQQQQQPPAVASPVQWQQQPLAQQQHAHQQLPPQLQQPLAHTPEPFAALPSNRDASEAANGHPSTTTTPPPAAPARITLRINPAAAMVGGRTNSRAGAAAERPRRAARSSTKPNYNVDNDDDDDDFEADQDEEAGVPATPPPAARPTRRSARRASKATTHDDEDEFHTEGEADYAPAPPAAAPPTYATRRSGRTTRASERAQEAAHFADEDDFEKNMLDSSPLIEPVPPKRPARKGRYIPDPDDEDEQPPDLNLAAEPEPADADADADGEAEFEEKPRSQRSRGAQRHSSADAESFAPSDSASPSPSSSPDPLVDDYIEEDDSHSLAADSPPRRTRQALRSAPPRRTTRNSRRKSDSEEEAGGRRNLRKRGNVNYTLPPIDLTAELAAAEREAELNAVMNTGRGRPRFGFGAMRKFPWMSKGKDNLAQAMGDPDSSDSDDNLQLAAGPSRGGVSGPSGPNVPGPTDVPNFGRVNPKSANADADPLGVDVNVTFDRVGGLDHHINQLKEMVALPLLYPELFKQFGIIPPRGVLFHGPPGTGKTLLARALAASCSNGNTKISFFMRKGADVLSKWVGEAERQLRMLFEEARASQPSIIFFDEIDGLAPVRSSKQDQIHASLVSTLLALMDGMDGRGQVIVIGATNRPDSVDPALRRPGRFDREFYFPLPNLDARRQIIKINTREWTPQLPDDMLDTLATLTKGYGGADLRALSTEAALNAIQRRYPQIYKTTDRLLVEPGSIHVQPKDFMLAVKQIIPSSARSASSTAIQLPKQLVPLLAKDLERLKAAVDRVLPRGKRRTALEEAEFIDEDGDTFEKEIMLQSLDKLRTYRPRLVVYGPQASGQIYLGPAILHHLEGFHVQSFDLATLMSDSTRTIEAAIVQLFVEAKRHQPSVIFIPSLSQWAATISDAARATARALLDGIPPSDPVLLLAIVDGPLNSLPPDVRSWFGFDVDNRIELGTPSEAQRAEFFAELLATIERKPTEFPDGVPRKRRVLEVLPLAPPLPPRQPTEAEIARDLERDANAQSMLTVSFSGLMTEFVRKYKRPVALAKEAAFAYAQYLADQEALAKPPQPQEEPQPLVEVPPADLVAAADAGPVNGGPALMEISGEAPVAQLAIVPPAPFPETQGTETIETFATTEPSLVAADTAAAAAAAAPPTAITGPSAPVVAPAIAPAVAAVLAREAVEGSVQPSEAPSAAEGAAAPHATAHDIDLDMMQNKLTRHKYLTPDEFLADIALIEENARCITGTPEQLKVVEMCAHAKVHVQTFDPKWTPEFARYAQRVRERRAERRAKREREKAEAAEAKTKEAAAREEAQRQAPGTNGVAVAVDGQKAEAGPETSPPNGLKRPREEMDVDADGAPAKRPREDMDVDVIESLQNGTQLTAVESIHSIASSPLPAVAPAPAAGPSGPKPGTPMAATPSGTPKPPGTVAAEPEPEPARTPTPPPVYPPFTVPADRVARLRAQLESDTDLLTVEELEQLRAMLLDCVWRARTQWDRGELVEDMVRRTGLFVREVREVREMERGGNAW